MCQLISWLLHRRRELSQPACNFAKTEVFSNILKNEHLFSNKICIIKYITICRRPYVLYGIETLRGKKIFPPLLFPVLSLGQDSKFRFPSLSLFPYSHFFYPSLSGRRIERERKKNKKEQKRTFAPSDIQIQKRNNSKTCFSHQVLHTNFPSTCFFTLFEL